MAARLRAYLSLLRLQSTRQIWAYQPSFNRTWFPLFRGRPMRSCVDRLAIIERTLPLPEVSTYLDIGSQLGFFPLYLGSKYPHLRAYGVDESESAVAYSNALAELNRFDNISFTTLQLTPQTVSTIGRADIVSFLSVFHHIVARQGFDAADVILRTVSSRCRYLVFETGSSSEQGYVWSESARYMGESPGEWLRSYLLSLGLTILAEDVAPTHAKTTNRSIFVCDCSRLSKPDAAS